MEGLRSLGFSPARSRGHARRLGAPALLLALVPLTACGSTSAQTGPVLIQGAVNGVYRPGLPGSCGPGETQFTGPYGPQVAHQTADLDVKDGSFTFTPADQSAFQGDGVNFRPGSGWDIDGSGTSPNGARVFLKGHIPC